MAERRMLHKKISLSEQFNDMTEFAQLLFALMIPHADDWGVVKGNSRVIRAMVIPLNEARTPDDVEAALEEMEGHRLMWRYEPDAEGPMLQLRKWEEHQTGLSKRTVPKQKLYYYPAQARELLEAAGIKWDYEEFHGGSENFPETLGTSPRTEQNRTEGNGTEAESNRQPYSQIFTEVTDVLVATGVQAEEIDVWMEDISEEWFRDACKEAVDNNARKWAYVRAILERWSKEGKQKRGSYKRSQTTEDLPYNDWLEEQEAARKAQA